MNKQNYDVCNSEIYRTLNTLCVSDLNKNQSLLRNANLF